MGKLSVLAKFIEIPDTSKSSRLDAAFAAIESLEKQGISIIRWGIVGIRAGKLIVEAFQVEGGLVPRHEFAPSSLQVPGFTCAIIIPTGYGAAMGGFVGDSGPFVRTAEAVSDAVIVNPNAVNGADLYGGGTRSWYTDGFTLDGWFRGDFALSKFARPKIGILVDNVSPKMIRRIDNAVNAMIAVRGVSVVGFKVCEKPINTTVCSSPSGLFAGAIGNPVSLLDGARQLVGKGANCIGVFTDFDGISKTDWMAHYSGDGVNPIGATEALISRFVTWAVGVPCAHAPISTDPTFLDMEVDPRASAEVISRTGIPCVLEGLSNAAHPCSSGGVLARDLSAIVMPFGCVGGMPVIAARKNRTPLIVVRENVCRSGLNASDLELPELEIAATAVEAIGILAALKAGVTTSSLSRPPAFEKKVNSRGLEGEG